MNRTGMKYKKITLKQREMIYQLKRQRFSIAEIHNKTKVNKKTIQSMNSPCKKSPYKEFKRVVISFVIDYLGQLTNLENLKQEKNQTKLKQMIKEQVIRQSGKDSKFKAQIPKDRVGTQMRRIILEIRGLIELQLGISKIRNCSQKKIGQHLTIVQEFNEHFSEPEFELQNYQSEEVNIQNHNPYDTYLPEGQSDPTLESYLVLEKDGKSDPIMNQQQCYEDYSQNSEFDSYSNFSLKFL